MNHDGRNSGDRLGLPDAISAVLFDMDGVLTDTAGVHEQAWKNTFDDTQEQRCGYRISVLLRAGLRPQPAGSPGRGCGIGSGGTGGVSGSGGVGIGGPGAGKGTGGPGSGMGCPGSTGGIGSGGGIGGTGSADDATPRWACRSSISPAYPVRARVSG